MRLTSIFHSVWMERTCTYTYIHDPTGHFILLITLLEDNLLISIIHGLSVSCSNISIYNCDLLRNISSFFSLSSLLFIFSIFLSFVRPSIPPFHILPPPAPLRLLARSGFLTTLSGKLNEEESRSQGGKQLGGRCDEGLGPPLPPHPPTSSHQTPSPASVERRAARC